MSFRNELLRASSFEVLYNGHFNQKHKTAKEFKKLTDVSQYKEAKMMYAWDKELLNFLYETGEMSECKKRYKDMLVEEAKREMYEDRRFIEEGWRREQEWENAKQPFATVEELLQGSDD